MKRFIKSLIKFLIFIVVILIFGWFGINYYFTHVNRIADKVHNIVLTEVQAHHSQLLTYNDIPEMYRDEGIQPNNTYRISGNKLALEPWI